MGVRGLTGFIARNAELYLTPYELHDCNLVIDGDNLACNLYKDATGTYSAFGGDYDDFYRAVVQFFHVLDECNIRAYVLMDGGYEQRKLRTVGKRLRGKISVIKRINPCGSIPVFPLMMKEVFVDALRDCGVPVMRCIFEADDELAVLSRKLRCPVLSYDSDFYIHNVRYIPLITLTVKAHTKRADNAATIAAVDDNEKPKRRLRKNEGKHLEKLTKGNRILGEIQVDNVEKRAPKSGKTYKYLDCCMYRIENIIAGGSLSKEKLPLFAALLGNDYIARTSFKNFFAAGLGKSGRSRKMKQQQRRIRVILKWLKGETLQTALDKILSRLQKQQRASLLAQVNAATSGYSNEKCHSYDFFVKHYANAFQEFMNPIDAETNEEKIDSLNVEENSEDESDEDLECSDEEEEDNNELENLEEGTDNAESADDVNTDEDELENELTTENAEHDSEDIDFKLKEFPAWFLEKLYPAHLARFFVDLMHLKKYINSPQIEHFPHNDCHEIALPILIYIFTLLNTVNGAETQPKLADDGAELPIEFTYLTRATRVTNIRYYRYAIERPLKHAFNPRQPNPLLFRSIFEGNMHDNLNVERLFEQVDTLPPDLRLYALAIVYWLQKSQHCDLVHLHSLLICAVMLRTIDAKIPAERDLKAFQKRFGKIIKKERQVRDKEQAEGKKRCIKDDLKVLAIPARMEFIPKSDCFLVQDNMLRHFHMQEIFKKKYDAYSSTVLHAYAEFQAVVFQLNALSALLDFPYVSTRMGQLYCGVLLYNLYDLLMGRVDVQYYVENFIFRDSQMMFDFYCYLLEWCTPIVPHWKLQQFNDVLQTHSKRNSNKKHRKAALGKDSTTATTETVADPNADMVDPEIATDKNVEKKCSCNKFCVF